MDTSDEEQVDDKIKSTQMIATTKDLATFIPDTCDAMLEYDINNNTKNSAQIPNIRLVVRDTIDSKDCCVDTDETSDKNLLIQEQLQDLQDLTCPETQIPPDLAAKLAQKTNVAKEIPSETRKFTFKLSKNNILNQIKPVLELSKQGICFGLTTPGQTSLETLVHSQNKRSMSPSIFNKKLKNEHNVDKENELDYSVNFHAKNKQIANSSLKDKKKLENISNKSPFIVNRDEQLNIDEPFMDETQDVRNQNVSRAFANKYEPVCYNYF